MSEKSDVAIALLNAEQDGYNKAMEESESKISSLRRQIESAREIIKDLEFKGCTGIDWSESCYYCHSEDSHKPDCKLAVWLKETSK